MATLTVGLAGTYQTIAAALAASAEGDTIAVSADHVYTADYLFIDHSVTLQAVGGEVRMDGAGGGINGKGIIISGTGGSAPNVTINGFEIFNAAVDDGNGAAIRYQSGNLTLTDCYFHDNQDGILATPFNAGTGNITITHSEFAFNGDGSGSTHDLYIGNVDSFSITDSYIHDAIVGHEIKSRANNTTITNNRIFDNNGSASYTIDIPNGGNATITGNQIQQSPNTENPFIIAYAEEAGRNAGTDVTIANNTIVNDDGGWAVLNRAAFALPFSNNDVFGLDAAHLSSGPLAESNTRFLGSRPALDTAGLAFGTPVLPPPPPPPPPEPEPPPPPPPPPPEPEPPPPPPPPPEPEPEPPPPPPSEPPMKTVFFGPGDAMADLNEDNVNLVAIGNHFMFVGGTNNTISATGGMEFITAPLGHNTVTTGDGNDYLFMAGGGNRIDAGGGINTIYDMANPGDTIVMPTAGSGFESIILTPGADPTLVFQGVSLADIHAIALGGTTLVAVGSTAVAAINNVAGAGWDLSTLLAHAVTT